jgi:hypothetical protein
MPGADDLMMWVDAVMAQKETELIGERTKTCARMGGGRHYRPTVGHDSHAAAMARRRPTDWPAHRLKSNDARGWAPTPPGAKKCETLEQQSGHRVYKALACALPALAGPYRLLTSGQRRKRNFVPHGTSERVAGFLGRFRRSSHAARRHP